MDIGVFIPSGSQFDSQIPDGHQRKGSMFWSFLQPVLGLPAEHLPWHNEGVSREIAEIRAYEARRAEANNSVPPRVTLGDLAHEAVTHVKEAIKELKPRDRAKHWLMSTLAVGPMLAETVKEMAKAQGFSARTLRRAFESGNFGHAKNADGRSVWSQPQAGQS